MHSVVLFSAFLFILESFYWKNLQLIRGHLCISDPITNRLRESDVVFVLYKNYTFLAQVADSFFEKQRTVYTNHTSKPHSQPHASHPPPLPILYQRLPPKHPLPNLPHHILPISFSDQYDSPAPSTHPPRPPQPMDEIDRRMRHIVQNDMTNR